MTNATDPHHHSWRQGFWALMLTQFQNGFSDLALKTLIVFLVLSRPMPEEERNAYVAYTGALFSAPFIIFSMFAGWLADRFSKQRVMQCVKLAEIFIMLFASVALFCENLFLELAAVFLWVATARYSAHRNMVSCRRSSPKRSSHGEMECLNF